MKVAERPRGARGLHDPLVLAWASPYLEQDVVGDVARVVVDRARARVGPDHRRLADDGLELGVQTVEQM